MEIKNYDPADIEIHSKDGRMVLREKSLIAFSTNDRKILAFGADAEKRRWKIVCISQGEEKFLSVRVLQNVFGLM